ncbi:PIR protein [Plasmodium yoelii yoelii]|uniref:PIR protein n=1 Tax=Plasmodium yoelii yoelii TaxID=73239 RepID=A0AAE9WWA4_PLAYO|nr:PIR protein [Plasmodium yoelii yoelii]
MSINNVCSGFDILWKHFPDGSNNSGNSSFRELIFMNYCPNKKCDTDINKINAGCLWLFNYFFVTSGIPFHRDFYKHVVVCIMIWLSYKLNQKTENGTSKLNDFYLNNIANKTEYTEHKIYGKTFKSYKEIIDQINEYMDIDINKISKFYELLKLLCNMIADNKDKNSSNFSDHANKFVVEYEQLLNDDNNIDDSSYDKILRLLSNYYTNFEQNIVFHNIEMNRRQLPTKKTAENDGVEDSNEIKTDEPSSETGNQDIATIALSPNTTLSGSSLVNKIISVLSIFGAIAIFFGISYKYSLFGFRKRAQKQNLREKLKK